MRVGGKKIDSFKNLKTCIEIKTLKFIWLNTFVIPFYLPKKNKNFKSERK